MKILATCCYIVFLLFAQIFLWLFLPSALVLGAVFWLFLH